MTTRKKLEVKYDFDFHLYGIITPVREYKLAWIINKKAGIHLVKQQEIELEFIDPDKLFISNYTYETEHALIRLLCNKAYTEKPENRVYLIPELKRFDYFFLINNTFDKKSEYELITTLKKIPEIHFISELDINQIKSRDNLILF